MRLPPLKAGIYKHYKGHYYQVLGYAHDANAEDLFRRTVPGDAIYGALAHAMGERIVVVYFGLELDGAHTGPRLAVRDVDDFLTYVDPTDGSRVPSSVVDACQGSTRAVLAHGYVPRFEYCGPELTSGMVSERTAPSQP